MVAIEGGGQKLGVSGVVEHVTGDLFDSELIEGHVIPEGVDDPVAPGPVGTAPINLISIGICVAGGIDPEEGHAFGVGVGRKE